MGGNVALNPHNVLYNNQNREIYPLYKIREKDKMYGWNFLFFRDTCEEYSNIFCEDSRQPLRLRI